MHRAVYELKVKAYPRARWANTLVKFLLRYELGSMYQVAHPRDHGRGVQRACTPRTGLEHHTLRKISHNLALSSAMTGCM